MASPADRPRGSVGLVIQQGPSCRVTRYRG